MQPRLFFPLIALIVMLLAGWARAETFPGLYDVTGVASDDVLNIRVSPHAGSKVIGSFAPDTKEIEVISTFGNWGMVNTGEESGWASMSFLSRVGGMPDPMALFCFGTEPFWSLDLVPDGTGLFSTPDGAGIVMTVGKLKPAVNRLSLYGLSAAAPNQRADLILREVTCNDGMSDRDYGLETDVILSGAQSVVLTGCCTLQPPNGG